MVDGQPVPLPGDEALSHPFPGDEARLCAFHAATEPLLDESNELGVSLQRAYLKGMTHTGT